MNAQVFKQATKSGADYEGIVSGSLLNGALMKSAKIKGTRVIAPVVIQHFPLNYARRVRPNMSTEIRNHSTKDSGCQCQVEYKSHQLTG